MPRLNIPVQPTADSSALTRRFGPELVTYGSGSGLNRVSFLRDDAVFLRAAVTHPDAAFVVLASLDPLVAEGDDTRLRTLRLGDVWPALAGPEEPFAASQDEAIEAFDPDRTYPLLVLLGLQPGQSEFEHRGMAGRPWFAVDATPRGSLAESAQTFIDHQVRQNGGTFLATTRSFTLEPVDAAIYAQARALVDWNTRHGFCASCGRKTLSIEAGYKRSCPPTPPDAALPPCPIGNSISNVSFPRTDAVVIAAVVSSDSRRLLLGRNRKWPAHRYSVLAGFVEAGESVEEAVRREVWEESGVRVGRVVLHSTQTWPYPNSLMIGAIAQAADENGSEDIFLGHDPELDTAAWFTMDEVADMLRTAREGADQARDGVEAFLPPVQAIANRLLTVVVRGFLTGIPDMDGM